MTAGPSLCIAFRGVSTSPAQLGKYIAAKRPGLLDGSAAAAAAGSDAAHPATAVQLGLSSVWAVTDVLQVRLLWRKHLGSRFEGAINDGCR